ncbi:MAG: TadE/TadG family type IV pilus assembly protein [Hyphomicrobiales bacterium]
MRLFWRDSRGVSAVEFAMILSPMLILFLGTVEITNMLDQDRKISRVSNTVTDLVAQAQTITTDEIDGITDLGKVVMAPNADDGLEIIVASVSFDPQGDASVDWSHGNKTNSPWDQGDTPPIILPDTVATPNTSIVVGQTNLTYVPKFSGVFSSSVERISSIELSDTFYLRPRLTNKVSCTNC